MKTIKILIFEPAQPGIVVADAYVGDERIYCGRAHLDIDLAIKEATDKIKETLNAEDTTSTP
jgi:hypothetical protein